MKAVSCIGAFAHDVCFERDSSWEVFLVAIGVFVPGHVADRSKKEKEKGRGDEDADAGKDPADTICHFASWSLSPGSVVLFVGIEPALSGVQPGLLCIVDLLLKLLEGRLGLCFEEWCFLVIHDGLFVIWWECKKEKDDGGETY